MNRSLPISSLLPTYKFIPYTLCGNRGNSEKEKMDGYKDIKGPWFLSLHEISISVFGSNIRFLYLTIFW